MDKTNSVNYLIEKGYEEEKAATVVDKMIETMNKDGALDEMTQERADMLIRSAIDKHFRRSSSDFVRGIVIGFGKMYDKNSKLKETALKTYADNPEYALSEGMVRLNEAGEPVALHYEEFIGKDKSIKNRLYGQEIKPYNQRMIFVLVDGEVKAFSIGDTPEIGREYKIFGTVNGRFINGVRRNGFIPMEPYTPEEIWEGLTGFAEDYEYTMSDVDMVQETDLKTPIVLVATVKNAGISKKGTTYLVLEDENSYDDLLCFGGNEWAIANIPMMLTYGQEVFVYGTVSRLGDKNIVNVLGFYVNPMSKMYSDMIDDLDTILSVEE